jgi:DNA repair protein RecN (Recombination protein N)
VEKLASLGSTRQVLCITHLPPVAAAAKRHFRIEKTERDGAASARVEMVEGEARVEELSRMLGGDEGRAAATEHARELLAA